jgi:5-formyltetrahydrofolate cyclo-ligase
MSGRLPGRQNASVPGGPHSEDGAATAAPAKAALRAGLLAARAALPETVRARAARRIAARVLELPETRAARTVAAYVSIGSEPATDALLSGLAALGLRVLLPVLRPDLDLDWAVYAGPERLAPAGRGLREPVGPRLGTAAVAGADVVVVPALAVDRTGRRLGRGGGSYDRALARVDPGSLVVALLHDGEVLAAVPAEDHDHAVGAAITPSELVRFAGASSVHPER